MDWRKMPFLKLVLVGLYLLLLLPFINGPAVKRYDQTDIPRYLSSAKHHAELGLGVTYGRDYNDDGTRHLNHPGLLGVTLSVLVRFLGAYNSTARLLVIFLNVITWGLLLWLVGGRKKSVLMAGLVFLSMPIILLHGRDVMVYSPVVALSLLSLIIYVYAEKYLGTWFYYLLIAWLALVTASYDWVGFLIFPLLFFWELQEKRRAGLLSLLVLAGAGALGIVLGQNYIITGSIWEPILGTYSQGAYYENRVINLYNDHYSVLSWFNKQRIFAVINFGGAALLAAGLGLMSSIKRIVSRSSLSNIEKIAWAMGGTGLGFIFVSVPVVYVHSYMQWLLVPSVFLFAMIFFERLPAKYYRVAVFMYLLASGPMMVFFINNFYSVY
jgi:4-amino-4-deoxy-L-arabinose transferase-like glycosyltransferase